MLHFLVFSCVVYGLSYLQADAKIFGCSTQSYQENPEDQEYLKHEGVFPFRLWLLNSSKFFRKLFSCYFCMGVWNGPIAHVILLFYGEHNLTFRNSYFLGGPMDLETVLYGVLIATLVAPVTNYVIDISISLAEFRMGA